ncbi:hypothetical protein [uncultured Pseudomonas sp.]|uniref:hypothetical protein n=1 Tax=uncultured Pseudomonas sp. TaxID=114707 RepID=UPI00258DB566|nr:hypothetical protein [uncultured Pseudomonas sp.]
MKKSRTDFDFVSSILEEFFDRRKLRNSLSIIHDQEITGWEVWIQIELANFLSEHITMPQWCRELPLEFDYRREKTKWHFKPDFILRKKGWRLDQYVALEIKQHHQAGNCITNMIADLAKVAKMRKSEIYLKSAWALGIFHTSPDTDALAAIEAKLVDAGLEYHESVVLVKKIRGTPFTFALF